MSTDAFHLTGTAAARGNHIILQNLNRRIPQHKCIALIGPNGAGKTTLLRLLAGLEPPAAGAFSVLGTDAAGLSRKQFAQKVCYIPQGHAGVFTYTVRDFTVMGRNPHQSAMQSPSKEDWAYADRTLESLGLTPFAGRYYTHLSSGEAQLVMLARGMVQNTPILLLDEPTANLDFYNEHKLMQIIRTLCTEEGKTVVISIHNPALALQYADIVYCIHDGTIAAAAEKNAEDFEQTITRMLNTMYAQKGGGTVHLCHIDGTPFVYLK